VAYGRVLAVAAAKAFEADDVMQFSDAAKIAIVVERSLHDDFMKNLVSPKKNLKIHH
jgi:thiaminase/transcriptional activator TenA